MTIKTIGESSEFKLKVLNSIFIGKAFTINGELNVKNILSKLKKEFFDATHHCFAYKIFDDKLKYSDDGEPNGTAGIRILNVIEHFELNNILIVVIRYFGGTKLGTGLLGKAYYNCAYETISKSKIVSNSFYREIKISFDTKWTNSVYNVLSNAKIENSSYDEINTLVVNIKEEDLDRIFSILKEKTKNEILIELSDKTKFF